MATQDAKDDGRDRLEPSRRVSSKTPTGIDQRTFIMRSAVISAAVVMLTLAAGVALAQDITITVAPGVNLADYRLYRWVTIDGTAAPDEGLDNLIKSAVQESLGSRGVSRAAFDFAGQRSLFIVYQVAVARPEEWKVYSSGSGLWTRGPEAATTAPISVGALQLDMYDPGTKKLVWQGRATNTLSPTSDPKEREARLRKAIEKLLADFPPPMKR